MGRKITPILWTRQTQDGDKFIYIRLTENRKSSYFSIGKSIPPKFWNKDYKRVSTKYPSYQEINELIDSKIREIEQTDLEILKGKNNSYLGFFLRFNNDLEKANKIGSYKKFNNVYNHVKKFLSEKYKIDLLFKEITIGLLEELNQYFVESGISDTTRRSYLKIVKRIYNKGLQRDLFITYKNPFTNFKLPKETSSHKSLSLDEFNKLTEVYQRFNTDEDYLMRYRNIQTTTNLFLFSFYAHGMRFGDLIRLKWGNIVGVGNRLEIHYKMNKTNKDMQVPLYDHLVDVLRYFLPINLQIVYLVMTNRDRGLYYSLNNDYKKSLLNKVFNGKVVKVSDDIKFNLREDFDPLFFTNHPMKNLMSKNHDKIDRSFLKKLILIQVKYKKDEYIFQLLNKENEKLSNKQLYEYVNAKLSMYNKELKLLQSLCNINKKLSSHISRHSFSDLSRKLGVSIYDISKSLNHQDLSTTQHYLDSSDNTSVEESNLEFYDKLKQDTKKNKKNNSTSNL